MLERYITFQPKPNTIEELKKVLQTICTELHQQGRIEISQKTLSLCESWGQTL